MCAVAYFAAMLCTLLVMLHSVAPATPDSRPLGEHEGWARDVLFVGTETIVIAGWDGRSHTSTDAGKTWTAHEAHFVQELTLDPRGSIWGLYRWHGIHEESSAALVVSKDLGTTWSAIRLDPLVCMPEQFVTVCGEEPVLVAADGRLWRHEPGAAESFERWKPIGVPNAKGGSSGIAVGSLVYTGSSGEFSEDRGAHWKPAPLGQGLGTFARAVDGDGKATAMLWGCTDDGELRRVELGRQDWKVVAELAPKNARDPWRRPHVFDIECGRDGLYLCGEDGNAFGARVESDGRIVKLEGLQSNQALRLRSAPDGQMWIVGHGVYRAAPKAKRWERVWPN